MHSPFDSTTMTNPPTGGPAGGPQKGPPPAPGPLSRGAVPTYRQQQQQEQQRRQHALAGAAPGSFIDLHLERLISIGGEGLLQPRSIRQAPATALVNGSAVAVADMVVDQGTPEFWVRYLFDELVSTAAKNALAGFAGRNLLLDFYNRVFWRPDDFETAPKPF